MSGLKDLKTRISSVKSSQKVTKVMKMVSASKLRNAQLKMEESKVPTESIQNILKNCLSDGKNTSPLVENNADSKKDKSLLFLIISSDRGLCGGFNSNLLRLVKKELNNAVENGIKVKLFCIGKKSNQVLENKYKSHIMEALSFPNPIEISFSDKITSSLISLFDKGEFDKCHVFYNEFLNAISQKAKMSQLLPIKHDLSKDHNENTQVFCEPSKNEVANKLIPMNISMTIHKILLESFAGEQGARMTAMDNATNNAGAMVKDLTMIYNRRRQEKITTELIEIISGANS